MGRTLVFGVHPHLPPGSSDRQDDTVYVHSPQVHPEIGGTPQELCKGPEFREGGFKVGWVLSRAFTSGSDLETSSRTGSCYPSRTSVGPGPGVKRVDSPTPQ